MDLYDAICINIINSLLWADRTFIIRYAYNFDIIFICNSCQVKYATNLVHNASTVFNITNPMQVYDVGNLKESKLPLHAMKAMTFVEKKGGILN